MTNGIQEVDNEMLSTIKRQSGVGMAVGVIVVVAGILALLSPLVAGLSIAIAVGDLPPVKGGGMTTTTTTGGDGGGIPDDTLQLRLSNNPLTCEAPRMDNSCGPEEKWSLTIGIPFELQEPGVYSFDDLTMSFGFVQAGVGEDCGGGGGGGLDGTLTIESIGPKGLVGCVETEVLVAGIDANGTFAAEHCSP